MIERPLAPSLAEETFSYIEVSTEGGVRTIQLNRPGVRNALSSTMQAGLVAAFAAADQDPDVRAVILTGSDPAFCAGNDFTDLGQFADRYANRFRADPGRALRAMTTPVICAVNGACVASFLVEHGEQWRSLFGVHVSGQLETVTDEKKQTAIHTALDEKHRGYRLASAALPESARQTYSTFAVLRLVPDD